MKPVARISRDLTQHSSRIAGHGADVTWVDVEAEIIDGPQSMKSRTVWVRLPIEQLSAHLRTYYG